MAALSANVTYGARFDPRYDPGLVQFGVSAATDIYYYGGIAYTVGASGLSTLTPAATADFYAGVVMEGGTKVTGNLVWLATSGVFWFTAATIIAANRGKVLAMPAAALFDNPADLAVSVAGTAAGVGQVKQIDGADGVGWVNTNIRITDENL